MLKRAGLGHLYHYRSLGGYLNSRFRRPQASIFPCRWTASVVTPRPTTTKNTQPASLKPAPSLPFPADVINRIEKILSNDKSYQSVVLHLKKSPELLRYILNHKHACTIAERLVHTRIPSLSLRFLRVARHLGCEFSHYDYDRVCFRLAEESNWNGVLSAVYLAQQHRGHLSLQLLNWRTRAYVETENYKALGHILTEFKEHNLKPTRRTFHLILSGHIRNCDLYKAKECLQRMTEADIPPNTTTYATIATHYRRLGLDMDVEAMALRGLEDVAPTTAVSVLNHLITFRLDAHDVTGALQLSTLFNKSLMEPIIATIIPRQDLGSVESANSPRIPTISVPITPNAATYSLFMNYHTSRSNLRGALQIFRAMLMAEIQVTGVAFASVITALYIGGKGDIAVRMVANLCGRRGTRSPLFDRLLSSTTTEDLPWDPEGVSPTIRIFNSFIKGVLSTHGLEGMDIVLQIMHDHKVKPTSATLEILMNHVKRVEGGHARVLSRLLRRLSSSNVLPTLRHMHIIWSSVLHNEKNLIYGLGWNVVAGIFSKIRKPYVRPYPEHRISSDGASFDPTAGIEFPKALRQRSLVRPAIESLKSRDILSDAAMFSLRMRHDSLIQSNLDAAKEILEVMLERGIHPNEYHFSALMEGFARAGDLEGACDVMNSASRAGVKPNVVMFTILIVGYGHKGNPDKAIQVFEDMVSLGIAPDVPSIDAVVSAFFIIGAYKMAKTILRTLWTYIQPFPADFEHIPLKSLAEAFRSLHKKQRSGDFELSKERRLALHFDLNRLMAIWNIGKMHRRSRRTSQNFHGKLSSHDPPNE